MNSDINVHPQKINKKFPEHAVHYEMNDEDLLKLVADLLYVLVTSFFCGIFIYY